ncbi:hypothetical protein [Spirochaeta isovalerica]|uniref:Uncharacterized protein n=1 Tax=Spirochaeta isovalerica TaxID=150 RepID=A0A841R2H4_9SPIO|nr:hypothetical protein [Spirochaeta isovalerica]MBB6479224.1 hypothetical protein [Spirochaeta isovalerica]
MESTSITGLPENIQSHLNSVIKTFGLDNDEQTMARLVRGWQDKEESFRDQMCNMGMDETGEFDSDDKRGALALTYSGSLISIGPMVEGDRKVDYTSIGFRQDVPETLTKEGCTLAENMVLDRGIKFLDGPIKQTSPLYKIVVCPEDLSASDQEDLIEQATTMIIDSFAGINQDTMLLE